MPVIKDYTAQVDQLRPTETGVEALAMEGRRAGAFYNQAAEAKRQAGADIARAAETRAGAVSQEDKTFGQVGTDITTAASQFQDYEAHQDVGRLAPALSKRVPILADAYQDALSPKNLPDPSHADMAIAKFNEQTLEPAFQDMIDAAQTPQGKKFAQDYVNHLRDHYYEKQAADKANLAGIAVKNGMAESDNAWSNTAYNDPSHLDSLIGSKGKPGLIDTSIAGLVDSNPNLRGVTGQQLKTDMTYQAKVNAVHSAFLGALQTTGDPDALIKQFDQRYPDYIKPAELTQMTQAARATQRINQEGRRAAEAEQRRQATGAFHRDMNQIELSTIDENGNSVMPPDLVRKLKDTVAKYGEYADPSRVNAMVARVKELGKTLDPASAANLKKTSDSTERQLYTQMVLPQPGAEPLTEDKINTEYSKGNLQFAARNRLLKDLQDDRSPDGETLAKARTDFFRNYAATIDPGRDQTTDAGASALGSQKIGEAQAEARRLEGVLRSQGKDPHSLYDPSSPDFFGKKVTQFRATLQDKVNFDAQLKADQDRKQAIPGTINRIDVKETPRISTKADYDKLPGGSVFIGDDGKTYRKP